MNRLFNVMPQHLKRIQVRTLTRPLHFVFLQPFRGGFAGLRSRTDGRTLSFRICWQTAEFMVPFITASLPGPEAAKQLPTTIFYCWYDVIFLKCCVTFTPDVMGHTPSKKFNFCLVSPQSIFPKVLGIIKMFSDKTETSLFFFLLSSGFRLGTHFCPVSFLRWSHEHWP